MLLMRSMGTWPPYLLPPVLFPPLLPLAAPAPLAAGPPEGPPFAGFTGFAVLFQRVQPLLPVPLPVPPPLLFATISLRQYSVFVMHSSILPLPRGLCQVKTQTTCPEIVRQVVLRPNIKLSALLISAEYNLRP
jgi:hypothetical protein